MLVITSLVITYARYIERYRLYSSISGKVHWGFVFRKLRRCFGVGGVKMKCIINMVNLKTLCYKKDSSERETNRLRYFNLVYIERMTFQRNDITTIVKE